MTIRYADELAKGMAAALHEQDNTMLDTFIGKDKCPDDFLKFGAARLLKVYLEKKIAEANGVEFRGRWIHLPNEMLGCSICMTPRRNADLNGFCCGCGAMMEGAGNETD